MGLTVVGLTVVGCGDLPPVQVEGQFISYAASEEFEVCEGTVKYAEEWTKAVAAQLGIAASELLPITYYYVDADVIAKQCPDRTPSCVRREDGQVYIFSPVPLLRHQLVHAIHASVWPARQPILHEGLAATFDDPNAIPSEVFKVADSAIDSAIEAHTAHNQEFVHFVGHRLVYFMLTRHGADRLREFWYASARPSTATDFRATFEAIFGESLATMLDEVEGQFHCPIVTCGEPLPWEDGVWTTASPQGCNGDRVMGLIGEGSYGLYREEVIEITEAGDYEVSVSEHDSPGQAALLLPCGSSCSSGWFIRRGETHQPRLTPGRYRVTTHQQSLDDPGVVVRIRAAD